MSKPKPKPIRLTKKRAEALLEAAGRGLDEWEAQISDALDAKLGNIDDMRAAKALDLKRGSAQDAYLIVKERFVDAPSKPKPDALF